jgi:hypothetical protein
MREKEEDVFVLAKIFELEINFFGSDTADQ